VTAARRKAAEKSRPAPKPDLNRGLLSRLMPAHRAPPEGALPLDRRTTGVFILATLLLVAFQYFGRPEGYLAWLAGPLQPLADEWLGTHASVAPFAWWALASLVLRVAIPFAVVAFVFREPIAAYGWKCRGQLAHAPTYLALYLLALPLILWAASLESFQLKYPFYKGAAAGGGIFWAYEGMYGVQFMGVEAFFRGFLTFALFRRFGYNALFIMAIPYVMVHFNKPLPEVVGALGAALVLGYLALRAGSFVPGMFLHWAVGITMDVLAIGKSLGSTGAAIRAIFSL